MRTLAIMTGSGLPCGYHTDSNKEQNMTGRDLSHLYDEYGNDPYEPPLMSSVKDAEYVAHLVCPPQAPFAGDALIAHARLDGGRIDGFVAEVMPGGRQRLYVDFAYPNG
jgi:hypothetical protein